MAGTTGAGGAVHQNDVTRGQELWRPSSVMQGKSAPKTSAESINIVVDPKLKGIWPSDSRSTIHRPDQKSPETLTNHHVFTHSINSPSNISSAILRSLGWLEPKI